MLESICVLQGWVTSLGLRHQGVLLAAVRGCDTAPKNDASKMLIRCYRAEVLNAFAGDAKKATTFIEAVDGRELERRMLAFASNLDHYPQHYVAHLMHAAEIVGYKKSDARWLGLYYLLCKGLHVNPETEEELDQRLNADEEVFAANSIDRMPGEAASPMLDADMGG